MIRRAEIDGRSPFDVRIESDRVAAIEPTIDACPGENILDAAGGALLPGLHDHHIHLFALAAAERSVQCGPPHVRSAAELARALAEGRAASQGAEVSPFSDIALSGGVARRAWLRGFGYHESVAGDLDRSMLDSWVPDRPLRIQHRCGVAWFLNSAAIRTLRLDEGVDADGVERGADARATGRLFRCDAFLRAALGESEVPSLASVSTRLARYGVTGVTDATATNGPSELEAFVRAVDRGDLIQRLHIMGNDDLPDTRHTHIRRAARKIVLDETALPSMEELTAIIRRTHETQRSVAIHCVTRTELVLACAALRETGSSVTDRIEHAAVAPTDALELLANVRATVVTQPNFVLERGDEYLADVDERDRVWLYRCAGLLERGIPVGGGTDAPYGDSNPWLAMQAAVSRTTRSGRRLGIEERVTPERALKLFTSDPAAPGGEVRAITVGAQADLCLLDCSWSRARERLSGEDVRATFRAGRCVWRRD